MTSAPDIAGAAVPRLLDAAVPRLLDTARPRLLLLALCLALWLPGFFVLPPGDRDESRFVQASKQMIETGDYVRIRNGAEERNRKPIGIHWLQVPFAAAAWGLGVATANPVWPYRVPSFLGGLLAVQCCFGLGRPMWGQRAALLGAGMLAASLLLVVEAHIAKTDAALAGVVAAAMALLGRAYLRPAGFTPAAAAGFWLLMGVGILLKGPIAPMVAGLAALSLFVADRERPGAGSWLRELRAGWGVPLALLVALPWFVAIGVATEGRFFADAVGGDLGRKLAGGDESHWGPPGLHLLLLPLLLFPASAALPGAVARAWRGRDDPRTRFLLAWIVPSWLVFELAPTKLPHYVLPLYPAVCLLLGAAVAEGAAGWRRLGGVLAGLGAALLLVGALGAPWFLRLSPWTGIPAAVGVLAVGAFAVRGVRPGPAVAATGSAALLYLGALQWELPRLEPLWIAPRLVPVLPAGAAVGAVGFAEPSLMFLGGTGVRWLRREDGAAELADGVVGVLVVGDRDLAAVEALLRARGVAVREVARVPGFNYSRGRAMVLTVLRRDG